jgi:hypothetical protein
MLAKMKIQPVAKTRPISHPAQTAHKIFDRPVNARSLPGYRPFIARQVKLFPIGPRLVIRIYMDGGSGKHWEAIVSPFRSITR